MNAILDLLSERPHIEQVVLTQTADGLCGGTQTYHFLGALSAGRFLLIMSRSPINPEHPIELSMSELAETIHARSPDTDFVKTGDMPIVATLSCLRRLALIFPLPNPNFHRIGSG